MADFLTKEARSVLMSRVCNRGTAAERHVRHAVWHAGFRYRLNVRKLPGAPDLVLRRYKTAVLVQGCFWHGHTCRKGQKRPATNTEFWNRKLDGNIARDVVNQDKLRDLGWQVFIVWECRLSDDTADLLAHLRGMRNGLAEIMLC
jgi:DNA mismatch endonuclease (patch repair protein)